MAIIIDTNTFAEVFIRTSKDHHEFAPVLEWLLNGKGSAVYGGSTYLKELKKAAKFIPVFRLLKETGKVIEGDSANIDDVEKSIKTTVNDPDFDDPHLAAIIIDTKCKILCTKDTRSLKFLKDKNIYPNGVSKPAYYTSCKNSNLLCDKYIHDLHKPLLKLPKKTANKVALKISKIILKK